MANYLCIFSAPDGHIEFMRAHNGVSRDYLAGEPPDLERTPAPERSLFDRLFGRNSEIPEPDSVKVPDNWPDREPDVAEMEVNHRNVDLYHWMLNKTAEPVVGVGSIFQTWFYKTHSAIPLDDYNEDFAFTSDQLPALLSLVETVTPESIDAAFSGWCAANNKEYESSAEANSAFHDEFMNLAEFLRQSIQKKHGLVWVVS